MTAAPWVRVTLIIHDQHSPECSEVGQGHLHRWSAVVGQERRGRRAKASGYLRLVLPKELEHSSSHSPSPGYPSSWGVPFGL